MSRRLLVERIVAGVQQVVDSASRPVPVHAPEIGEEEYAFLRSCLESTEVSTAGRYVGQMEQALCAATGAKHAIATINGTAALQVSLLAVGVKPGEEVLMPSLTFAATANAVLYCGAVPHLLDCDRRTLGVDVPKLEEYLHDLVEPTDDGPMNRRTRRRIRAIVPVHAFGHPAEMEELGKVVAQYRIPVVEDAANALGSAYRGQSAGTLGVVGMFSFNGNKIITTGGGGAAVTNRDGLARRIRHLVSIARADQGFRVAHDGLGFNYRMPSLNAALGCAQLGRLESFVARKRALARSYSKAFQDVSEVELFDEPSYARSNFWLNTLIIPDGGDRFLETAIDALKSAGIHARPSWIPLHWLNYLGDYPRMDLACTDWLARRIVSLPSSANLGG